MARFLIGIDDTDNDTSPGTGQLARRLAAELSRRGAGYLGITRHQFLVDDRIPYTSHNSGACIAVEWRAGEDELGFAMELLAEWSASGSDPGICVADVGTVPRAVIDWGRRATQEVLDIEEAHAIANVAGICLRALGGSGQGVVGALGGVGLRAEGNEGRFLDLPGLREIGDRVRLEELTRLGICVTHESPVNVRADGTADDVNANSCDARYMTFGWVRPRLAGGRAVWPVQWSSEHDAWVPVDQKRSRPLE